MLATQTWSAQLDLSNGANWFGHCKFDAIDREDRCFWQTGDEFMLTRGDGYATAINWGVERFPGSLMIARLDDRPTISTTAESWSAAASRSLYQQMMNGSVLRYRWYSWPEKLERGGTVDLKGFVDLAVFLEALRYEFTVLRVLNKIPADR